jgi:hypothetical protein
MSQDTTQAAPAEAPLLSRTGQVSPIGTLIEDLKTKVDPETAQAFRRICAEAKTDVAGALRDYVCKVVHGHTYDELCVMAAKRRRLMLQLEGPIGALAKEHA